MRAPFSLDKVGRVGTQIPSTCASPCKKQKADSEETMVEAAGLVVQIWMCAVMCRTFDMLGFRTALQQSVGFSGYTPETSTQQICFVFSRKAY